MNWRSPYINARREDLDRFEAYLQDPEARSERFALWASHLIRRDVPRAFPDRLTRLLACVVCEAEEEGKRRAREEAYARAEFTGSLPELLDELRTLLDEIEAAGEERLLAAVRGDGDA